VFVVTADGVLYPAKIVGIPAKADMALPRIDAARTLPFVHFGDSDMVRVGDKVFAIGSPFGFDNTVTSGIISALNRDIMESPFDDYIQTDAAINHGNSGGPLFNMAGEVIGMNSVIYAPTSGSAGVGFAVPSNSVRFVFDRLQKTGKINAGMLPIHTHQVTWTLEQALGAPDLAGALVTSVQDDSAKRLRGKIKVGDIIRTFNGEKVVDPRDLARKAARSAVGGDAVLELCCAGVTETVHVTIQAWPDAKLPVIDDEAPRALGLDGVSGRGDDGEPVATVASVDPTGSAADSGIQKGDIILKVQQTSVAAPDQIPRLITGAPSATRHYAPVLVRRGKKLLWIAVRIPGRSIG
jgi:serine protease Do